MRATRATLPSPSTRRSARWGIPLGSTTVEIDLRPHEGGTELHLIHRGRAGPMADAHSGGWRNSRARLAALAEGRDPGPDPLAAERVPAARDLGLQ